MKNQTKSETIKATLKATHDRREKLRVVVYELKLDLSKCPITVKNQLKKLFIEAKWLYNHILATNDIVKHNTKSNIVKIKTKEGTSEERTLTVLSSQMKQGIQERMVDALRGLKARKKNGGKIGKLKFKSLINSIPLKQFNVTYKLLTEHKRIKIQGIKKSIKVHGFDQLKDVKEFANATLITKNGNYYLKVTCYVDKLHMKSTDIIGIDFGIKDHLTLSNGTVYNIKVDQKRLALANHRFSHKTPKSKNWLKAKLKLNKEYERLTNQKKDQKNKIVSEITNNFKYVCFQDENIKGWHMGLFGRQVQMSALGGIKEDLQRKSHTPIVIDRYFATTKLCPACGAKKKLTLADREYVCSCGYHANRDVHAANNILFAGLTQVPTECRDFKPVEIYSSNCITNLYNQLLSKKQEAAPFRVW